MPWKNEVLKMSKIKNWNGKLYKVLQGNKHLRNAEESANSAGDKSGARRISTTKEEVEKIKKEFDKL